MFLTHLTALGGAAGGLALVSGASLGLLGLLRRLPRLGAPPAGRADVDPLALACAWLGVLLIAGTVIMSGAVSGPHPVSVPALALALLALLCVPGAMEIRRLWRAGVWRVVLPRGREWLPVVLMVPAVAYAGLPVFRSDQWSYHLVVGREIARRGTLPMPVYYDHTYFTGVYEYALAVVRIFVSDDTLVQGVVNAFSLGGFLTLAGLAVTAWRRLTPWSAPGVSWWLCALLYGTPTFDMLTNAKPDGLMVALAMLAMAAVFRLSRPGPAGVDGRGATPAGDGLAWFAAAFLVVAPLALKLTWLHGAMAVAAAAVVMFWRRRQWPGIRWRPVLAGLLLGGVPVSLVLWKTAHFLGNPVHPMQIGPFRSPDWSESAAAYWAVIGGAARDGAGWLTIFANNLWHLPRRLVVLLAPAAAALMLDRRQVARGLRETRGAWLLVSAALGTYIVLWPFFYKHDIYSRFVYPVVGIAFLAVWLVCSGGRRLMPWILLIPALLAGGFETRVDQMLKAWPLAMDEFYLRFPEPMSERHWYQIANRAAGDDPDATLVSDNNSAYFWNGRLIFIDGLDYGHLWRARMAAGRHRCPRDFVRVHGIRLLFSWRRSFAEWSAEWQPLIRAGRPVEPQNRLLRVDATALPPDPPGCPPASSH